MSTAEAYSLLAEVDRQTRALGSAVSGGEYEAAWQQAAATAETLRTLLPVLDELAQPVVNAPVEPAFYRIDPRERLEIPVFLKSARTDVLTPMTSTEKHEQRFWRNVEVGDPDQCWHWVNQPNRDGYGSLVLNRKHKLAYRMAYEIAVGPIPDALVIDHTCHNVDLTCTGVGADCAHRRCCNPKHTTRPERKQTMTTTKTEGVTRGHVTMTVAIPDENVESWIEMAGFGIRYWAHSAVVDTEKHTYTVRHYDDPDRGDTPDQLRERVLTYQNLVDAACRIVTGVYGLHPSNAESIRLSLIDPENDEVDSMNADCIVQAALFGEVLFV